MIMIFNIKNQQKKHAWQGLLNCVRVRTATRNVMKMRQRENLSRCRLKELQSCKECL